VDGALRFDLGVSTYTERDADGYYRVQIDWPGGKGGQPVESYHPCGFLGRPRDPSVDPNGRPHIGGTTLWAWEGSQGHAIPLSDPRVAGRLPEVKKGGSIQYADTSAGAEKAPFALFDGANGSWQLYVPYGSTAATIAVDVSMPGVESVQIVHGAGMKIVMTAGGKNSVVIHNRTGNAYLEVNDEGVIINGNSKIVGSLIAGNVGAAESVALADGLLAWVTQVNAALAAIFAAAGNTVNPTIVAPTAAPLAAPTLKASPAV